MRTEVDLSFWDPESSSHWPKSSAPQFKGVIPGLRELDCDSANLPEDSRLALVGWLMSGLFHLVWMAVLLLLVSPFGHGRRTSITLEMGYSEPSDSAYSNVFESPPLLIETPARNADEPEEAVTADAGESAIETAAQGGESDNKSGEDDSSHEGDLASSPGQTGMFFGTEALGDRFVYIVDMSSSMTSTVPGTRQTRLRVAGEEVVRSVNNLTANQNFYVILFAAETRPMFDQRVPKMIPATVENKLRLAQWLLNVPNSSGTDPRAALRTGLRLRPSAIFLLSDGQFNGQVNDRNRAILSGNPSVEEVVRQNRRDDIPIHTIAMVNNVERRMRSLAESTGGTYRLVGVLAKSIFPRGRDVAARTRSRVNGMSRRIPARSQQDNSSIQKLILPQQQSGTNLTREQHARTILLTAATLWKRGDKDLAKKHLLELTKTYPNTKAAVIARRQLQK